MRFSIIDLINDVENYKKKREEYNIILENYQNRSSFKFWQKNITEEEVKFAFEKYIDAMQVLEKKYNPHYHNNLQKKIVLDIQPSAPNIDELYIAQPFAPH